jgi:hypothetical protein
LETNRRRDFCYSIRCLRERAITTRSPPARRDPAVKHLVDDLKNAAQQ